MKQREIKFRNWYKPQEGRIYSDIIPPLMIYLSYQQTIDSGRTLVFTNEERTWIDESDFEDPILMQFTGLKDINLKEIYENDIVLDEDGFKLIVTYLVNYELEIGRNECDGEIYYSYITGYFGKFIDGSGYTALDEKLEKIGDIYQNPELLK